MSNVIFNIDGIKVEGDSNQSILQIARANGIFIPAICYLSNCSPTLACRMCMVEIDGKIQYSCKAKPKDGMEVVSKNEVIEQNRQDIMRSYDVNHPLKCGTCDKSGECELQDYTSIVGVGEQFLAAKDDYLGIKKWGKRQYDPSLCILCERCVTTCSDNIGESALKVEKLETSPNIDAYKDKVSKEVFSMWGKRTKGIISQVDDSCSECGECVSVCPVGAFIIQDFQYTSRSWELTKIPSSCTHCSANCKIEYNVKHTSIKDSSKKIYRVKNDFHFNPICGAGKYGYDFTNSKISSVNDMLSAINAFKESDTIIFNSNITNEEALILQKLKKEFGYKLVNNEAYRYKTFLDNYSSIVGKRLYSATLDDISSSDVVVTLGSFVKSENPLVKYHINKALKMNKGISLYFHPLKDLTMDQMGKNHYQINYKPEYEEEVLYLLLSLFSRVDELPSSIKKYISGNETTFNKVIKEDDKEVKLEVKSSKLLELIGSSLDFIETLTPLKDKEKITLIVGEDLYSGTHSSNLAKLIGLLEKNSIIKTMIIPSNNSIGVNLICDLSSDIGSKTIGYNCNGDFKISANDKVDANFYIPALNQQEGTVCNADLRVVPLNVAIPYNGYCLNDIANELGLYSKYTIDYTKELPKAKGFKTLEFDSLKDDYENDGTNNRGYELKNIDFKINDEVVIEKIDKELNSDNLVYLSNPILQFSEYTAKSKLLKDKAHLFVSKEFLESNGYVDGEIVEVSNNLKTVKLSLKLDKKLEGSVSYIPTYDVFSPIKELFKDYKYTNISVKRA